MKINKQAQSVIDRLAAINYDEPPKLNVEKVTQLFKEQYELLGVKIPKVEVADDMLLGYKIARDAARVS